MTEDGVEFIQPVLGICNVEVADAGQYSCTVSHAFGNTSVNFNYLSELLEV